MEGTKHPAESFGLWLQDATAAGSLRPDLAEIIAARVAGLLADAGQRLGEAVTVAEQAAEECHKWADLFERAMARTKEYEAALSGANADVKEGDRLLKLLDRMREDVIHPAAALRAMERVN